MIVYFTVGLLSASGFAWVFASEIGGAVKTRAAVTVALALVSASPDARSNVSR